MRLLLSGATGFIGRALVPALQRHGHTLVVMTRSESRARARLGADISTIDAAAGVDALASALEQCDGVINLAGESIAGGRWTSTRRRQLRESRVDFTGRLVQAIGASRHRPKVLVSSSAVGYYGDRGNDLLRESSSPGDDFLARLCRDWESAARGATAHGVRVVLLRTGVVLGRDGGALARMLPVFRAGLGGTIGSGRQYLPWIHLHDFVALVAQALVDARFDDGVNAVAPQQVTNREFTRVLGQTIRRPVVMAVPGALLRLALGEASRVLLAGQRVEAEQLARHGFSFEFPTLRGAFDDIVGGSPVHLGPIEGPIATYGSDTGQRYLATRRPVYELRTTTIVGAPLAETFAFFSKAENLGLITPASMRFSFAGAPPVIADNALIDYRVRVAGVPINWRTRIVTWRPGERFVDLQERGPYRSWWHEHTFRPLGDDGRQTLMEDRVCYAPPFGPIGWLSNRLFIVPTLQRIFQYRADVIRLRFGSSN